MNKELKDKYLDVINDNVNVGKSSVCKEFIILLAGVAGLCFLIYYLAGFGASIAIDRMSDKTQVKIEKALSIRPIKHKEKPSASIQKLEKIKPQIVALDKKLHGKSDFPIFETDDKEINAFIAPDGSIYFTQGLLKEIKDEETLAFILAHELAHYAHRDHLKEIGREIIAGIIISVLTNGQREIHGTVGCLTELNRVKYSQRQEIEADLYANRVVLKLYGRNTGAVEFFEFLEKKENIPEFFLYFSTHPSPQKRLKLIKNN